MRVLVTRALVALSLAFAASGCFLARERVNEPLDAAAIASLEPGRSTDAEVAALLGAPTEVVQLGRRSAWRYDHARTKRAGFFALLVLLSNADTRADRVWVFFDEEGLLTHAGSTFQAHRVRYAMPWQDLDGD